MFSLILRDILNTLTLWANEAVRDFQNASNDNVLDWPLWMVVVSGLIALIAIANVPASILRCIERERFLGVSMPRIIVVILAPTVSIAALLCFLAFFVLAAKATIWTLGASEIPKVYATAMFFACMTPILLRSLGFLCASLLHVIMSTQLKRTNILLRQEGGAAIATAAKLQIETRLRSRHRWYPKRTSAFHPGRERADLSLGCYRSIATMGPSPNNS